MRLTFVRRFCVAWVLLTLATPAPTLLAQRARYTIYGEVRLPDGRPAARVIVEVTSNAGVVTQAYTNDQGQYELGDLPNGRYLVTASLPADHSLIVEPAEVVAARFAGSRLLANLFFRFAPNSDETTGQPTVSVGEMERVPRDAHKAFEKALKQKQEGKLEKARASLTRAIELFPEYFQALAARGELLVVMGNSAQASADFDRALKINPEYAPALRGAGFCKLGSRRFREAVADLQKAVALDPGNSEGQLFLGISNLALGRRDVARQSLQEALKLDPKAVSAHVYLANLHAQEGRFQAAADAMQTYLVARPTAHNADKLRAQEADWRQRASRH